MKVLLTTFLIVTLLTISGCKIADIRTEEVITDSNNERAIVVLDEMTAAHQSHLWDSIETYSLQITDEFYGIAGKIAAPFPKNKGQFQFDAIANTFTSRSTFTDKKWKGKVWGIQSWKTYIGNENGTAFHKKNNKTIEFWLPTYQYLLELPNRITEGTIIRHGGIRTLNEHNYELVFVSWKTAAPQKDIDQYLLWIDTELHQLSFVQYTVRDKGRIVNATLEYASYHVVDGLLIPKEMNVRFFDKKEGKKLHSIITQDVVVDNLTRDEILLDETLGTIGKP